MATPIDALEAVEDLHSLADECREWLREEERLARDRINRVDPFAVVNEFARLAEKLDEIAKRLAVLEVRTDPDHPSWNELIEDD